MASSNNTLPTCFLVAICFFCNSTTYTTLFRIMSSQIHSLGSMVRALRFVSERLPVLIQEVRFCPSGVSAPTLFKSSETKLALTGRRGGCLREDNSYCCWDRNWGKGLTVILVSGRAFFCQSPVASTWPLAGLSRDHFIPRLLISSLQSATLLFRLLLSCNGWRFLRVRFRNHFGPVMLGVQLCCTCLRVMARGSIVLYMSKGAGHGFYFLGYV